MFTLFFEVMKIFMADRFLKSGFVDLPLFKMVVIVIFAESVPPAKTEFFELLYHRVLGMKCAVYGCVRYRAQRFIGAIYLFPSQRIKSGIDVDCHASRVFGVADVSVAKAVCIVVAHGETVAPIVVYHGNGFFHHKIVFEHKVENMADVRFNLFVCQNLPLMELSVGRFVYHVKKNQLVDNSFGRFCAGNGFFKSVSRVDNYRVFLFRGRNVFC